ncbi:MAG: AAA family ATPase [Azospirillum sp.]|nr:AAA family ATPase [Azospirillum sp.]
MAGKIITIAQQKGGAGKTTLAAHLAVTWARAGRRVAAIDIDPQGSLTRWFETRTKALEGRPGLGLIQITGWRTQREVERLARENEMVIIDSPPHAETEARIAVRAASLVVVPVQPSPMDLWATQPTLDLARQEKVRLLLVLNRVPPRAKVAETIISMVSAMCAPPEVDLAAARIGNRNAFSGALFEGRAVTESARKTAASEEIEALATEIQLRLG